MLEPNGGVNYCVYLKFARFVVFARIRTQNREIIYVVNYEEMAIWCTYLNEEKGDSVGR